MKFLMGDFMQDVSHDKFVKEYDEHDGRKDHYIGEYHVMFSILLQRFFNDFGLC